MAHWIVTRDHVTTADDHARRAANPNEGLCSREGWKSQGYTGDGTDLPFLWRTIDDDGGLCYEGRASAESFEPLEWSAYDAGATEIYYRQKSGEWEQL